MICLAIKLVIKFEKSQEVDHRIVQWQLNVKQKIKDLMEKYTKKDMYFQKKRQQTIDKLRVI